MPRPEAIGSLAQSILGGLPALPHLETEDLRVIRLWLNLYDNAHTREAYHRDVFAFLKEVDRPLHAITLEDLQHYAQSLQASTDLEQDPAFRIATARRKFASVKRLFRFAHEIGYLTFDPARPIRLPKVPDELAQRILSEAEVHRLLAIEPDIRNRTALHVFYMSGARVSELAGLQWKHLMERNIRKYDRLAGQITLYGKGGKTRSVLLTPDTWSALMSLKDLEVSEGRGRPEDAVFYSRKGRGLTPRSFQRIVRAAAERAGIHKDVSPHWMRHAHASHALDRGAPIHVVRDTLGHANLATTSRYTHAKPEDSSSNYLSM